jgi:pimeloyl-ACP methyl ester carboxylesterase
MHVLVNGVRLFFDVEGAKLVPNGPAMREKPTLLLLHGGPGFDHSIYKPAYSALAESAQIVYLDHRGNGRSEDGPQESWNLAQWGDDVRTFCDVLGIVKPIVLGASFGGMVALAYATRHPTHPFKLVLISTEAAGGSHRDRRVELFERFGGSEVGALARRRFLEVQGHPDQASLDAWRRLAFPLYTRAPRDPDIAQRAVSRSEVLHWFTRPGGESHTFNMLPDLGRIRCSTLVLGGEDDPIHPIESQADIATALPRHLVQFERFPNPRCP